MEQDILFDMIDNPENYTKDEIYDAFIEMTEQYLDEHISNLNYERAMVGILGKDRGNDLIEKIAMADPELRDLETELFKEDDPGTRIRSRFDYIDGKYE